MSDISNFKNTNDYLPILNGSIIADIVVLILLLTGFIQSSLLKKWYTSLNLSACTLDVLVLVIGIIIARFLYTYIISPTFNIKFNLYIFIGLVILIQILHDILFYFMFQRLRDSYIFNIFSLYAKEVGVYAIIGDSLMIALAALLAYYLSSLSLNTNIIILILGIYILPYLLYSFSLSSY